jgi:unsaturated rhamnogalacturonyl hydrolase
MADTLMRRYPNPDDYPYKSWSYPQGFMLWGFIRLYEQTAERAYYDYVMRYCEHHVNEQGDVTCFTGESLDDIMSGSVLVWAYAQTGQERYLTACRHVRRAFDDYPRNADGGFWHGRNLPGEMWIDGLFMGLMFLCRYGAQVEDGAYCFDESVRQLNVGYERCEKDGSGLLYHAYSEDRRPQWAHPVTGKAQEVWCEGLGWYAMILPEVLSLLPADHPGRAGLEAQLQKLINALEMTQDSASGLWLQVVDKPGQPRNWHDTSGSAMFLWAIKKAGLIGAADRAQCDRIADKAYAGIKQKCITDADGNANIHDACDGLGVQLYYDRYVDFLKNVNSKEAIAAFFWAAVIMEYGV